MSDLIAAAVWFVCLPVLLLVAMVFSAVAPRVFALIEDGLANFLERNAVWHDARAHHQFHGRAHRHFLRWLAERAAGSASTGDVNPMLVQAHAQSELIKILIEEEIPAAVARCLETHRQFAVITGASHFSAVAYEPDCLQQRAGMVWILSHAADFLDSYPLRLHDATLLQNSLVLRKRALPACRGCRLITWPVRDRSQLCPTAELVQIKDTGADATA